MRLPEISVYLKNSGLTPNQATMVATAIRKYCISVRNTGSSDLLIESGSLLLLESGDATFSEAEVDEFVGVFGGLDFGQGLTVTDNEDGTATIDSTGAIYVRDSGATDVLLESGDLLLNEGSGTMLLETSTLLGLFDTLDFGENLTVTNNGDGSATIDGSAGSAGAPTDADYLVKTANASLSAERVVTDSTSITADWATPAQVQFLRAALTGDVTASQNSNSTTIANDAVTYAKMQNASANVYIGRVASSSGDLGEVALSASQLAGRGSTGDIAAITLGTGLTMSGTTISAGNGGITRGQVLGLPRNFY